MFRVLIVGTASLALGSTTPPLPSEFSSQKAELLDPIKQLRFLCGGGRERGSLIRSRLQMAAEVRPPDTVGTVPLMHGLTAIQYPITSADAQAKAYFNQGLALAYGFNHDAAIRAFRKAQALDPGCAMCSWGEAYARGPNINAPMDPEAQGSALAALERAMAFRHRTSPRERALIEALAKRYSADPQVERATLDIAYADAMDSVTARFPLDDDIAILAAEASMDTQPWDYWETDGRTPKGRIGATIAKIEKVLVRNPNHPQAIHLYIHLLEASATPEKAEAAADRLATPLVPAAGHLVHMPGHLYFRIGRFKDAIRVNVAAAKADEAYLLTADDNGIYRYGYYPHNIHFIVASAQMGGDSATAIDQAERLQKVLGLDVALALPWVQAIWAAPYFAHAQYSSPSEILAQAPPDSRMPYVLGIWRYSRAVAHALRRSPKEFEHEIAQLRTIRENADFKLMAAGGVPATDLLILAEHTARGRLALVSGKPHEAVKHFQAAIVVEDRIPYMEPPYWYYPVRQSLGAAQLISGDPEAARQTFRETLLRSPNNGWALYGLAEAQRRLGDHIGRRSSLAALDHAWLGKRSDITLERL